jgi:hypothetical protein
MRIPERNKGVVENQFCLARGEHRYARAKDDDGDRDGRSDREGGGT